eukprot:CAMPEP_0185301244 /NCGR_PEP_ID=MMETSP1363-20130426/12611_1 /TAXON_ID=38817 /ORGANISM="Gephyrocapsa oceanica, Strain RCC1303" /LENGTH=139 /DNA_ID=CAMNT_0027898261 /DNA_START=108 /DNA_END=524 /DNA_ORIENTATION=+
MIVRERLLAELEVGEALDEGLLAALGRAHIDGARCGDGVGHLPLAELRVNLVEALCVRRQLLTNVLRAEEDGLERAPRALHFEPDLEHRADSTPMPGERLVTEHGDDVWHNEVRRHGVDEGPNSAASDRWRAEKRGCDG